MQNFTTQDLGNRILDLRRKKEMNQNELAEKANTTRSTVSKWETGDSEPSATQLKLLADAFGVSVDYLLGNDSSIGENICVLDTCTILNRPKVIDSLVSAGIYKKIIIPDVVYNELNYQKDHAKSSTKQKAWLAMVSVEKQKDNIILERTEHSKNLINDDKIMDVAKKYALLNTSNSVDVLTNDVYFSLKNATYGIKNIYIKSLNDIGGLLYKNDNFDEFDTQKFINTILTKNVSLNDVKKAFKKTVDVNRIDSASGLTPLIIAIRNKRYDIIEYLASLDSIDLERRDEQKYLFTPLLHACQIKDIQAMKILIEYGANVNGSSRGKNIGNTPLMVCTWKHPYIEGIKLLMENEALSYNQQDFNGFTALHKACFWNSLDAIKLLIDHIDRNIEDFENKKAVELLNKNLPNYREISALFKK